VECGSALLCRFGFSGFSFGFSCFPFPVVSWVAVVKQEKPSGENIAT
jgi:hypothetical protein